MQQDQGPAAANEYEAQRAARIAENKQRMEALGVLQAAEQLHAKPIRYRRPAVTRSVPQAAAGLAPARASKRLRRQPVDDTSATDDNNSPNNSEASSSKGKKSHGDSSKPAFELTATQYGAPFMLPSVGVTVWDLGQLYRGPFSTNYYSSRGCLYRHAYPVGYRATKEVFGRTWEMTITAGERGPVFTVSEQGGTCKFSGSSPTAPWTDACLALRPSQRISGPKFFGFSDVHVQRALAAMYSPAELAYALYGTWESQAGPAIAKPQTQQQQQQPASTTAAQHVAVSGSSSGDQANLSDHQQQQVPAVAACLHVAEQYAMELQSIKGIGATTAQVLALTSALGGARHASLQGLRSWLTSAPHHQEQLRTYLLTCEEVPCCSRQLPAWHKKWVPMILEQLMQPAVQQ